MIKYYYTLVFVLVEFLIHTELIINIHDGNYESLHNSVADTKWIFPFQDRNE